ncbi:MAG TPA: cysteine desulfurase family protein [Bacteroidia bacterium]|nr:cysteine desulfurase family protein [Bacteroidia bacterium]
MNKSIYLDYNATTPVDPIVLETMLPYFNEKFGNAASRTHSFGWIADEAVELAREQVATFIGAGKNEIVFTSGATESLNLALKGVAEAYKSKGNHIVTLATEHKAVLDTCKHMESLGASITYLPVDKNGLPDLEILSDSITENTVLFCGMMANNETGVLLPVREIAKIVHEKNCLFLSDTTQACGKIPVDVNEEGIDILCISSHKMYGPKGTGAIYLRRRDPRVHIKAQQDGGEHEGGRRSGTLNVPGIVGFGKACELTRLNLPEENNRIKSLRDRLENHLLKLGNISINGAGSERLPNTSNLIFHGRRSETTIRTLNTLALATGSACSSAIPKPSHVLLQMGLTEEEASSSIRISLGKFTSMDEINETIEIISNYLN